MNIVGLPWRSDGQPSCNAEELRSLAARADLAAVAQRGEVMSRLAYMLEVFRGAMRGSGPKSQPALLGIAQEIADPLVRTPLCCPPALCMAWRDLSL